MNLGPYNPNNPNSGHGHVHKRPDGVVARCGGPALCGVCARDVLTKTKAVETVNQPSEIGRIAVALERIADVLEVMRLDR